nr:RNA methyltransferase [Dehalococcoidales bacterium]
ISLLLDGVQDPGNLGTILRTAEAAAARPVLLAPGTVDAYAPKVVRAAMGAHFRLPLVSGDWDELEPYLRGRTVWAAEVREGTPYYEVDWTQPSAIVVGSEAHGLSTQARKLATGRLTIPMAGRAESLNAAIATAIVLFEALRQRRQSGTDRGS